MEDIDLKLMLERPVYEELIRQIVYLEENMDDIAQTAEGAKVFPTQKRARWFFEEYVKEVESLFKQAEIVGQDEGVSGANNIPFIVLGSSFMLTDKNKRVRLCRMTYDDMPECAIGADDIYFLCAAGRALLLKRAGQTVMADIGGGLRNLL